MQKEPLILPIEEVFCCFLVPPHQFCKPGAAKAERLNDSFPSCSTAGHLNQRSLYTDCRRPGLCNCLQTCLLEQYTETRTQSYPIAIKYTLGGSQLWVCGLYKNQRRKPWSCGLFVAPQAPPWAPQGFLHPPCPNDAISSSCANNLILKTSASPLSLATCSLEQVRIPTNISFTTEIAIIAGTFLLLSVVVLL